MEIKGARDAVLVLLLGVAAVTIAGASRIAAPSEQRVALRPPNTGAPTVTAATVTHHVDGDTLRVRMPDGAEESVRLIGVDAPEVGSEGQPYGPEAAAFTAAAAPLGRTVYLQTDTEVRDHYGRLLAYVWLERPSDGSPEQAMAMLLQADLLSLGLARAMTIPPNDRFEGAFAALESRARGRGTGVWAR